MEVNHSNEETATQSIFKIIKVLTDISNRQLRIKTGLKQGNHSRYVNGQNSIGFDNLVDVLDKLDLKIKIEKK